jgi:hypothetical protein
VDVAPVMFVQVLPPSELICHCSVGVGVPEADAVRVTDAPGLTVVLIGAVEMAGAESTNSVAAEVVAVPPAFVKTARYELPDMAAVGVKVYAGFVAPAILVHVAPLVLTCHCTVGVGEPTAAAEKVTDWPSMKVWLEGEVVTFGALLVIVAVAADRLIVALDGLDNVSEKAFDADPAVIPATDTGTDADVCPGANVTEPAVAV